MVPFFDFGNEAKGFIAIGQEATGVIAIGQMAHGVIAIGQLARGVVAVGQVSIGIVTVGQLSMGFGWCLAQLGLAARGRGGVIQVLPASAFPQREDRTTIAALLGRSPSQGWVDLWLEVPADGAPRLRHGGEVAPIELPAAVAASLVDELGKGTHPVSAEIAGKERVVAADAVGYREAPPTEWVLSARTLSKRPSPAGRAALWTVRGLALVAMSVAFWLAVAGPFVEAF